MVGIGVQVEGDVAAGGGVASLHGGSPCGRYGRRRGLLSAAVAASVKSTRRKGTGRATIWIASCGIPSQPNGEAFRSLRRSHSARNLSGSLSTKLSTDRDSLAQLG